MPHARRRNGPDLTYVDSLTMAEWTTLAEVVLSMEAEILNRDDMEAAFRSVKWDARLEGGENITLRHFRLVLALVQKGRVHQSKHG